MTPADDQIDPSPLGPAVTTPGSEPLNPVVPLSSGLIEAEWESLVCDGSGAIAIQIPRDFPITATQLSTLIEADARASKELARSTDPIELAATAMARYTILYWERIATEDITTVSFKTQGDLESFKRWWMGLEAAHNAARLQAESCSSALGSEDLAIAVRAAEQTMAPLISEMPEFARVVASRFQPTE